MPLTHASEGSTVRLENLPADEGLRDRLVALGVRPGARLEALRRGRHGGILHLACGFLEFVLRQEHACQMQVTLCDGAAPRPAARSRPTAVAAWTPAISPCRHGDGPGNRPLPALRPPAGRG